MRKRLRRRETALGGGLYVTSRRGDLEGQDKLRHQARRPILHHASTYESPRKRKESDFLVGTSAFHMLGSIQVPSRFAILSLWVRASGLLLSGNSCTESGHVGRTSTIVLACIASVGNALGVHTRRASIPKKSETTEYKYLCT